jgi:hypothetical protein
VKEAKNKNKESKMRKVVRKGRGGKERKGKERK